jgi:hypothetical protein
MPAPPLPYPTLSPIRLEPTEGGTDEFPVPSAAAPPRLQLRDLCRKREHQLDQLLAAQLRQCVAPIGAATYRNPPTLATRPIMRR